MLHSRTLNNKIYRLYERVLRIVYSDYKSSFNTLLETDGSFSIHHRNKFSYLKLNKPPTCNLRTRQELSSRNPKTVRYGTETFFFSFDSKNLGNSSSKYKKLLLSFIIYDNY